METKLELRVDGDIVAARQVGREMARILGFGTADQTRLATAISELTRNALKHAGGGLCIISGVSDEDMAVVRVTVEDHGPGIADVDRFLSEGVADRGGTGAGLLGARRLVHEFSVESRPGYTKVTIAMRVKRR